MNEIILDIKPLSVNEAWRGRRYKTDKYESYERSVLWLLPRIKLPPPPYQVYYEFGFSNPRSDLDNPVKQTQDCLVKKYGFDDHEIYQATIRKIVVPKGKEYVKIRIDHFDGQTRK